jgi:hypothetical protein
MSATVSGATNLGSTGRSAHLWHHRRVPRQVHRSRRRPERLAGSLLAVLLALGSGPTAIAGIRPAVPRLTLPARSAANIADRAYPGADAAGAPSPLAAVSREPAASRETGAPHPAPAASREPAVTPALAAASRVPAVTSAPPAASQSPAPGRSLSPVTSPGPSGSAPAGMPGASDAGDPFYPTLGNGGYDTRDIDLVVTWSRPDTADPEGRAQVATTIDAVTTQDLSSLTLDLAAATTHVTSVTVDGEIAHHGTDLAGRKLLITLPAALPEGTPFQLVVASEAVPGPVPRTGEDGSFSRPGQDPDEVRIREGRGLIADGAGGMLLAAQPNGAHTLFPVNDHPLDKARVRITLVAPPGMAGVASGALERVDVGPDGSLTTVWSSARPVASHVVALAVGDLALRMGETPDGIGLRSAFPHDVEPLAGPMLAELPGVLSWLGSATGVDYPFETFGLLAYAGRPTAAILEGQTLVLVPASVFAPWLDRCEAMAVIVHEAAHQWFGDWASVARWDEKWLSEGHATWYEWSWLAEHDCLPDGFDGRVRTAYSDAAAVRAEFGPPSALRSPDAAYTPAIYDQGALALDALRREVGVDVFRRIERAFLRRYGDRAATTDDFIAVASRVARRDLGPFLDAWLRGPEVPTMPGQPDWTSGEPGPSPSASASPGVADDPGIAGR